MPLATNTANNYYVDSEHGNDENNGKSINHAWKSAEKVNSVEFKPGDKILFRRGQEFHGSLHMKGNGSNDMPVTLAAYGTGNRPVINAGKNRYAIMLMNSENWIIKDMETTGATDAGIFSGCNADGLKLVNVRIINCYVHDIGDTTNVSWDLSTSTGGIIVVNGSLNEKGDPVFYNSVYNNVLIEDCTVQYNFRWTCISITSGKIDGRPGRANRIRNCTVAFSSADGIRMNGVADSFIEYCVLYRNGAWPNPEGQNLGGLGAWFFDAVNCTIQYCEAGWIRTITSDGGAFDIDYRQQNSTVQYSYGHHCASYGVSVFGAEANYPTLNSTIRYNIFSSNAMDRKFGVQGEYFVFTWSGGLLNGVKIQNNISYWDPVVPAPAHNFNADFTGENPNTFTRNTVVSKKPWLAYHKNDTLKSDSNVFIASGTSVYWKMKKDSFDTLSDWQIATGMDRSSVIITGTRGEGPGTSGEVQRTRWERLKIPEWYKLKINRIPLKREGKKAGIVVGDKVPVFNAESADENKVITGNQQGKPVIITFTGMNYPEHSEEYLAVRAQMNYLRSMIRQYGSMGVRMIVVDESKALDSVNSKENWINSVNDLSMDYLTWIRDDSTGSLAKKFGIAEIPETYLVSGDGTVIHQWQKVVLPAEIAFAIEDALGL